MESTITIDPQPGQAEFAEGDKVRGADGRIGVILAVQCDEAALVQNLVGWFDTSDRHFNADELEPWAPGVGPLGKMGY